MKYRSKCCVLHYNIQRHVLRMFMLTFARNYYEKILEINKKKKIENTQSNKLLTSSFYLLKPWVWVGVSECADDCLLGCAVQSHTYVHVTTLADGVNNRWRWKQEEESSWALRAGACAFVSCRFYAGRDSQCRQMGNYQTSN